MTRVDRPDTATRQARLSGGLIRWRWPLLLTAVAASLLAWGPAHRLSFDRSIENMFAPDDPLLVPYRQLKRVFGGNEVVLVAYVDPQLLTAAGVSRVATLRTELTAIHGVTGVLSLADSPVGTNIAAPAARPLVELFEGLAIGEDHQTAAAVCLLEPDQPTRAREATIVNIRRVARKHDAQSVVAGEPVMVVDGFAYLEEDGRRLSRITTALMVAVIFLCFRSLRWVVIPLAIVQATIVWTEALLVVNRLRLSMVSSMLSAIVTVIGIATVVHLIVRFREARGSGLDPRSALTRAGALLAAPIVWACLTDAAGFGALAASRVGPVQSFGVMTALGALLTAVAVASILPGLSLAGRWDVDPQRAWGEGGLEQGLHGLARAVTRRPYLATALSTVAVLACLSGYPRLEVETDFTRNFRAASPIVTSYRFVEERLGGAGVWDLLVPAPAALDESYLKEIRALESDLRSEVRVELDGETHRLTKVVSLVDILDAGDQATGNLAALLPLSAKLKVLENQLPFLANTLYATDPANGRHYYRIMLRAHEQQPTTSKMELIRQVERMARARFPEAHATGFFVLLGNLIDSLLADQWLTFSLATLGIGLMMLVAFRDPLIALVALVPNALPIVMVLGLMGHLGLKINMGTVMIASVSMGLSVDSSIHYLTAFRRAVGEGRTLNEAIDLVHASVGRAMVFSTLALVVGFTALCLSHFVPTIYFGMLVSLSMLGGLAGNLVVLPLLLRLVAYWRGRGGRG